MTVILRPATFEDAQGVANVYIQGWINAFSSFVPAEYIESVNAKRLETNREELSKPNPSPSKALMIAQDTNENTIVGICTVGLSRDTPAAINGQYKYEMYCVYVLPSYHGKGIAKQLVASALKAFNVPEEEKLYCNVFLKNNRAMRFYEKLGAVEVYRETTDFYSPSPEVVITLGWPNLKKILN
ncbi:hypothetical protein THRCLA_23223 [Thraustotheca clavata]|uniref:N-acetyltransferase domain-containing protein n=1 Tax=Thraustotheca clavata TaxID=74557 RepID=A0A1V9Y932_9STRA|nr:hypothetical protein THRCLA_23223 [Thraustotheca clavata]